MLFSETFENRVVLAIIIAGVYVYHYERELRNLIHVTLLANRGNTRITFAQGQKSYLLILI